MKSVCLALALWSGTAFAHKPSDGFITLDVEGTTLSGQLDLALRDLAPIMPLDADGDGRVTWGELRAQQQALYDYAGQHLKLAAGGSPCALKPLDLQVSRYTDGAYASVIFDTSCDAQAITTLDVTYDALYDVDAQHRGLLKLTYREQQISAVLTPAERTFHFDAGAGGAWRRLTAFVQEGLHHIYRGVDHVLFLVALVIAAVFVREGSRLLPQQHLTKVLWDAGKVVTSFTLAHSLALALTTFRILPAPPTRIVEGLVALTILLTALNNVWPVVKDRRWLAGFGFGLIHGIGYASVLSDLGLTGWSLATPLLGFNLGVELAQLTVLMGFLPLAFLLRSTAFYRRVVLWGGSLVTAGLAAGWIIEVATRLKFLPF